MLLDRPHHGTPVGLLIALGLLALCLLAIPLALLARRFDRFPGARHAWGEAAYRAGGTWTDFLDWARPGGGVRSSSRGGSAGRCSGSAWSRSAGCSTRAWA